MCLCCVCVSIQALKRTFTRRQDKLKFILRHKVNIRLDVQKKCDYDSNQRSYLQPNACRRPKCYSSPPLACPTPNRQHRKGNQVSRFRTCVLKLWGEVQTESISAPMVTRWKFQHCIWVREEERGAFYGRISSKVKHFPGLSIVQFNLVS